VVVMTYQYEDEWGRQWEFAVEAGKSRGIHYMEIGAVWLKGEEVPFDIIDSKWIKDQEDKIELEMFG